MGRKISLKSWRKGSMAFWTLASLLVATFLLGGGSRADILSLVVLRPVAVVCLALGLYGLRGEHWETYKVPMIFMALSIGLVVLHLIPLPPALWMMLPGRELAIEAGAAMGGDQPWRPISLVPYRAENAFFAMLVPAAAMVLAVQLDMQERRNILLLFLGFGFVCALWAIIQIVADFKPGLYLYAVSSNGAPTGLFANRNHTAALFVLMFPILSLVASRAKGSTKMVINILCAALACVFLLMTFATGSRGGLVFAVLALGGAALVWRDRPQSHYRTRRGARDLTPYFVAGASILGIAGFAYIMSRADALDRLMKPNEAEQSRTLVWQTIVDFLPGYMPFGSGIGSFVEIFKVHEPNAMLELNYWNHAHNDWLEWVLEGGVPALLILIAAVVAFAIGARKRISRSGFGDLHSQIGLVGTVTVFVLGLWSLVDYPLRVPSLACLAAISAIWMVTPRGKNAGDA